MGAALYIQVPDEIFCYIMQFLGDKLVIKCSILDKRLYKVLRNDILWMHRIKKRFGVIDETITGNYFDKYTDLHIEDFIMKNIVHTKFNDIRLILRSPNFPRNLENLLLHQLMCGIDMICVSKQKPFKLAIRTLPTKGRGRKGKEQEKYYCIIPNVSYRPEWGGGHYNKIIGKNKESLLTKNVLSDIISLLIKGYFIVNNEIPINIGNKLIKTRLAVIV